MDGRIWVEGRRRLDRIGMVGDRTVTCLVSSLSCPVLSCLVLSCLALSFFFFFFFASTIEQILFGVDDWGGVRQRSPGLSFLSFFLFFFFLLFFFSFFCSWVTYFRRGERMAVALGRINAARLAATGGDWRRCACLLAAVPAYLRAYAGSDGAPSNPSCSCCRAHIYIPS